MDKKNICQKPQYVNAEYLNPRQRKVTHSSNFRGQKFTDVFVILPATEISNTEMAFEAGRWGSDWSTVNNCENVILAAYRYFIVFASAKS